MSRYTMLYVLLLGLALLTLAIPATARLVLRVQQKQNRKAGLAHALWLQELMEYLAGPSWWDNIRTTGMVLGVLLLVVIARPCMVAGSSMDSTLYDGQLLYTINAEDADRVTLKRGEIVCLQLQEENKMLVKRVIGMPGDYICLTQGKLYLNGQLIHETYIREPMTAGKTSYACQLAEDLYFVMGDNRNVSRDSRSFGLVSREEILSVAKAGIGKGGIDVFHRPEALAQTRSLAEINTMKGE